MLIGAHGVATDAVCGIMSLEARLHAITIPTLVVSEAEALAPCADLLTEQHHAVPSSWSLTPLLLPRPVSQRYGLGMP